MAQNSRMIDIVLIEDSQGDIMLIKEALAESGVGYQMQAITDGESAMEYLRRLDGRQHPDLIILDLNLPRINGQEILKFIKSSEQICNIPVIVLTTSSDIRDIDESYRLHANCFISKPVNYEKFIDIIRAIDNFWFKTVTLPKN
ncbi:MAG: response regulator [Candidatus Kapaibacterium sp.]